MANITRYPQPMVTPLSEAVDRLFRDAFTWPRVFGDTFPTYGTGAFSGSFGSNLYETNDAYIVQVMLPGVKADELQITAHQNVLTLQGTSAIAAPEGAQGIWVGLGGGEFRQQMTLSLPKAESARVKTIKIGAAGNGQPVLEGKK